MFGGVTFGQFIPKDSLLHRLDPRAKTACLLAAVLSVLAASGWPGMAAVLGLTMAAAALSGLKARFFLGALRSLRVLLAVAFLAQALLTPGEALFGLGPLKVTREGLAAGADIFLRLSLLILLASLLTYTTSPIRLAAGLESLMSPFRRVGLPAHELAMMMTIAMRFVPTLLQEAEVIIKAQRSRGAGFAARSGPAGWAAGMLPLFVPLFAGALRRAEDLAVAMEARCYRGGANRTRMMELKLSRADFAALAVSLTVLAAVIYLR